LEELINLFHILPNSSINIYDPYQVNQKNLLENLAGV